ncbi:MAG: PAS domain S-box protein [Acidobacteria bacterium]|nr:PAS domain S-box protein [Acidobacteriota bacterium]
MTLRRPLASLITVRAVISTLMLGSATLVQLRSPGALLVDPFFFLIGLTYALTAIWALTLKYAESHRWIVNLQLAIDTVIVTAFIGLTGGVTSYFSSLYVLPVIAASTLLLRQGGIAVASLGAVLYAAVVSLQYWGPATAGEEWFRVEKSVLPLVRVAGYTVAINAFGFIAVAILSGSLAERLRRADKSLAEASDEIANLQALNEHIIDSLVSGLVTTDYHGRIVSFNRGAELITGYGPEEVMGQQVQEVLRLPAAFTASMQMDRPERANHIEYRFTAGGQDLELALSASHLETPKGRAGLIFSFQDVTDIKRLERESQIQQRLAALGEMAAGIAHEIRNPLASMSGSIQVLRQELPLSDEQAQLMDIVLRESERLNSTIRSFLAYARPQRLGVSRLDLRRVLEDTALLLRNSTEFCESHRIDVDAPAAGLWYEADEGQLRQIVWNLASNGLKAMPSGGTLWLRVSVDADGDVVLAVQDEGVGIASDQLDGIFQPFHGAFEKGSGLGLAIVHRLVSEYSGEIQITSQPGKGTTVAVRLPLKAADQEPALAAAG